MLCRYVRTKRVGFLTVLVMVRVSMSAILIMNKGIVLAPCSLEMGMLFLIICVGQLCQPQRSQIGEQISQILV